MQIKNVDLETIPLCILDYVGFMTFNCFACLLFGLPLHDTNGLCNAWSQDLNYTWESPKNLFSTLFNSKTVFARTIQCQIPDVKVEVTGDPRQPIPNVKCLDPSRCE